MRTPAGLPRLLVYAVALGLAAFALEWIEYQYVTRVFATEFYIVLIAVAFTLLGVWLGQRLLVPATHDDTPFEPNRRAQQALGISEREYDVLAHLATGRSNKEIARQLDVSPNTVKTHLSRLFAKLEVRRRTQAVNRARNLGLIP